MFSPFIADSISVQQINVVTDIRSHIHSLISQQDIFFLGFHGGLSTQVYATHM